MQRLYRLHPDVDKVIVSLAPDIRVSCLFPASSKTCTADCGNDGMLRVEIPHPALALIMTVTDAGESTPEVAYLMVCARGPYELANVHPDGDVCWGKVEPAHPRAAWSYYWSAPMNADLWSEKEHECDESEHECGRLNRGGLCSRSCYEDHNHPHECEGREHAGEPHCPIRHVCITCHAAAIWWAMSAYRRTQMQPMPACCVPEGEDCPCDDGECECTRDCACCDGDCSCDDGTGCECCDSECECGSGCACCDGDCSCEVVECDECGSFPARWTKHLTSHAATVQPEWGQHALAAVYGESHWQLPPCQAVLISDETWLLARSMHPDAAYAIGAANRMPDGTWEVHWGFGITRHAMPPETDDITEHATVQVDNRHLSRDEVSLVLAEIQAYQHDADETEAAMERIRLAHDRARPRLVRVFNLYPRTDLTPDQAHAFAVDPVFANHHVTIQAPAHLREGLAF